MTHQAQDGVLAKQQWIETHEVMAVDPSGITVRITTEGWSEPGQVLVGALYVHETRYLDVPLQRFDFPLASGEKWNQWARNSDETMKTLGTTNRHVRVGRWEKVSTPAGTFDAIKLGVMMDAEEFWRGPTTCTCSVWYAPAVRNVVREKRDADDLEKSEGDSVRTQHALLELSDFTSGSR